MKFLVKPGSSSGIECGSYCFVDCWRVGHCDAKRSVI